MSRWLAAITFLAGALAAGAIVFQNGGAPVAIQLTPGRTIALPLGTAIGLAFATGVALVTLLAVGGAVVRASRRWRRRRGAARREAVLARERVRAETLLLEGDADGARARLADAVDAHGRDERLLELLAGASEQSGDVTGAIAALEAARARGSGSPLLARRLTALYAAAGRWEEALALETELVRTIRSPEAARAEAATFRGLRLEAAAADPDAARGLRRLLGLAREHPGFASAWVAAGDQLRARGRTIWARRVYERGARARPAVVLLERLVALDTDEGHPEWTLRTLGRLRRHHPDDTGLLAVLARRHLQANDLERAEAALASGPSVPALEALRGECARRQGRFEQAALHFARALDGERETGRFHCRPCGAASPAWSARCPRCGRWDTLESDAESRDGDPSAGLIRSPSRSTDPDHCVTDAPG